jgi:hypothetical protein
MILEDIWMREVAMNPAAYADSMTQAAERGVLVGFEFEVLVPREALDNLTQASQGQDAESAAGGITAVQWAQAVNANWRNSENYPEWWSRVPVDVWDRIFTFRRPMRLGREQATTVAEAMRVREAAEEQKLRDIFERLREKEREKVLRAWNSSREQQRDGTIKGFARWISRSFEDIIPMGAYGRMFDFWSAARQVSQGRELLDVVIARMVLPMLGERDAVEINMPEALAVTPERVQQQAARGRDDDDDDDFFYGDKDYDEAAQGMAAVLRDGIAQGQNVRIFQEYHQSRKALDTWYIEPDGSLDDPPGGTSMEVVSPPLPAAQAIPTLRAFTARARELGLETDDSTGLHINVSIPDRLDILKLLVFSGDEYVLRQFQREESDYAESVMRELESFSRMPASRQRQTDQRLIKYLEQTARQATDSHTASISRNSKYISFRHAGDDYLNNLQSTVDVVGRFVRAMVIAATPGAYREEYLKRLAALIEPGRAERRAAAGQAVIEPSSAALNWVRRNGWPAVTVLADSQSMARSVVRDVAPDFGRSGNTGTWITVQPSPEDGVLPRDLKKWAMLPNDLDGVDIIVRAEPQIRAERLAGLTTVPVTSGEGQRLYQQALRIAQRRVGKR